MFILFVLSCSKSAAPSTNGGNNNNNNNNNNNTITASDSVNVNLNYEIPFSVSYELIISEPGGRSSSHFRERLLLAYLDVSRTTSSWI